MGYFADHELASVEGVFGSFMGGSRDSGIRYRLVTDPDVVKVRKADATHNFGRRTEEQDERARKFVAESREVAAMVEGKFPDGVGWVVQNYNTWVYVTKGHPKAKRARSFPGVCPLVVHGNLYSSVCGRAIDPDGDGTMCKMHHAHRRREVERAEQWRREREERIAESERIGEIRDDLRAEWEMACESIGIERSGDPLTMQSTGRATVDSEALGAILRYVIESKG